MKVLQLKDVEGDNLALYVCPDEVDSDVVEKRINLLETKHIDDDNMVEIIDENLATIGVTRVYAENIFANSL